MAKRIIEIIVNGDAYQVAVDPWRSLAEVLREDLGLTGTKLGCRLGDCGACTVLVDGRAVSSCLYLAVEAHQREVTTIEGLARSPQELHPLQEAFVEKGAVQCGFCTPGMIMSSVDLLARKPEPSEREIREGLGGNLCRCTGYNKIVEAVATAGQVMRGPTPGKGE
ncbi:MAG: (2Fe-2S)-binding protein [Deltaproteobacteria bacterium]|nr:(2Fe-2S)-binding protein [Deltaproteobacteria bacterium]